MVAQVLETTRNLSKGPARRLFATTAVRFEPAPAGNGFDLTLPNSAPPDVPLVSIVNWFAELRAKFRE